MLEEATTIVEHSGEHCYEAELSRLTGIYLAGAASKEGAAATRDDEAVDCFHRAIARAHRQGARALELRAASDLARLLQRQGKIVEAWQALSEVYACFTEGFDTRDLREAKALLDALDGRAE
jgi:adenylate cyclase